MYSMYFSEDFDSIRGDRFQLQAAKLIASKPMVAISGKGGCGKTYVVTKVITAAKTRMYVKLCSLCILFNLNILEVIVSETV